MKSICLYFAIHQPYRLRTFRFFDIGDNHHYYDDFLNRTILKRVAQNCYLPANEILLGLIKQFGAAFKVSFSISGTALEQIERYSPETLASFKKLAKTGNVEFLAETYAHSLSSFISKEEFQRQVAKHSARIEELFGVKPVSFRNSELIYSNQISEMVADMGFQVMLTEAAKHVLGWKSPNYLYCSSVSPKLKVLMRNFQLSDDLAFRFSRQDWSEWPLTADKFASWLNAVDPNQEVINLFLDYQAFGEHQKAESGIFEFLKALPKIVLQNTPFEFKTPSQLAQTLQPIAAIDVPYPMSWADEERDLTAWLGNDLQKEAFHKLYEVESLVKDCQDPGIQRDWEWLQTSDHFYYMSTKWFSDGDIHQYFNPYGSPYEAFINYMNVLSDFLIRVEEATNGNVQKQTKSVGLSSIPKKEEAPVKKVTSKKSVTPRKTEIAKKSTAPQPSEPAKKSSTTKKTTSSKTVKPKK